MATSVVDEWTEKLRESRFGQDHFGPKVAQPLARWLGNFNEDAERAEQALSPDAQSGSPGALGSTNPQRLVQVPHVETELPVVEAAKLTHADESAGNDSGARGFVAACKDLAARIKVHNLVVVAAGIAFWGLLAIPATLIAVVSIAGLVLDSETVKDQVNDNLTNLPPEAKEIIGEQLEGVSGGSSGGLIAGVAVGLLLALWTSSGAMAKLIGTLNTIYNTQETRNFAKLRGTALALTFGGIIFISSAIFLLAVLPALLGAIDGVGDAAQTLFGIIRFPVLGLVMVIALGVLYHVGPNRTTTYRPLTWGAVIGMALWIGLSGLFSVYTATAGSYNETYGSIAGLVILLLWLFITAFTVLLGAELHARSEGRLLPSSDA